jgi:hypothetical protein
VATIVLSATGTAAASNWVGVLGLGSHGEAQARVLPSAPSGVSAACTSAFAKTIKVTWNTVATATTYSVYESTTSASTGYSLAASGVAGTSWTSGTLSNATYWFEVAAFIGTKWASPNSAATASHAINTFGCA